MPTKNFRAFYRGLDDAVEGLYRDELLTLADDEKTPDFGFDSRVFERAAEWVRERGGFTPSMLQEQPARDVIDETFRILGGAVSSSIGEEMPAELTGLLENNAFIFSGLKTYHSLNEVGLSLIGDDGGIKPFEKFHEDVAKIDAKYNRNYLYAEYNHAVTSSQMAAKWHDFQQDGDRYNLQYRTANDERVREEHQRLHIITLPVSDPFWEQFMPPNGWNCRCVVVQVRKGRYPESDSQQAVGIGEEITEEPKKRIFRFNPGKELKVFPDKHPYNKAPEAAKKIVAKLAEEIKTPEQAVRFIQEQEDRRAWFERGFKTLEVTRRKGVNGSTDMNGNIDMTRERLDRVLSGLTKLRQGGEVSFEEADALATFWHEITHNRNKPGNEYLTTLARRYMELANEFVARKTLPEFYESFGGKMQHPEFMDDRQSTGYNTWVRNYCSLIRKTGADPDKVLDAVREHLFNEHYSQQAAGLVKAIKDSGATKADGTPLKVTEIKTLVKGCLLYGERMFDEYVNISLAEH